MIPRALPPTEDRAALEFFRGALLTYDMSTRRQVARRRLTDHPFAG